MATTFLARQLLLIAPYLISINNLNNTIFITCYLLKSYSLLKLIIRLIHLIILHSSYTEKMNNSSLPLESQLEVERLKVHLKKYPEPARELAILHFEDYLELVWEYKKLEKQKQSTSFIPQVKGKR